VALLAPTGVKAQEMDCCEPRGRGVYAGVFGGGGCFHADTVSQVGVALFPDVDGGPLFVNANGEGDSQGAGLVGLHIGYEGSGRELGRNGWAVLPAVEFEGFYLGGTQRASVSDPNNRLRGHVFDDTFPIDSGVFLTGAVLSIQTPSRILAPYAGIGVGAACVSINGADSPQVVPPEPGVNHFDSDPDASCWGFAGQFKVGARLHLTERLYVFSEYRFLYVSSTNYTFGSTVAPGHVPTSAWNVHFGDLHHHMGVGGIGFNF
jgi:hypothetical protein